MNLAYAVEHLKTIDVSVSEKTFEITGGDPYIQTDDAGIYLVIDGWLTARDLLAVAIVKTEHEKRESRY